MKNDLLEETVELLNEVKLKYNGTESCVVESIDQAIENLTLLQEKGNVDYTEKALDTLVVLGKVLAAIPEIREILSRMGLL